MKRIILCLALMTLLSVGAYAQTKVIAHRGYWKTEGVTGPDDATTASQNSINSQNGAARIGVYGSEFDIWSTTDGELFVNHDGVLTGVPIQTSKAADVRKLKLPDGEYISTLDQYLANFTKHPGLEVVLEVKEHKNKLQEDAAVRKAIKLVDKYGLMKRTTWITFSLNAMLDMLKWLPQGSPVYYLDGELSPKTLKKIGAAGLDYQLKVMKKHPEWFKKAHELGLKVNVWTVNKPEDMQWCIDQGADFITTNEPVTCLQLVK